MDAKGRLGARGYVSSLHDSVVAYKTCCLESWLEELDECPLLRTGAGRNPPNVRLSRPLREKGTGTAAVGRSVTQQRYMCSLLRPSPPPAQGLVLIVRVDFFRPCISCEQRQSISRHAASKPVNTPLRIIRCTVGRRSWTQETTLMRSSRDTVTGVPGNVLVQVCHLHWSSLVVLPG